MDECLILAASQGVAAAAATMREATPEQIESKALQFARSTINVAKVLDKELSVWRPAAGVVPAAMPAPPTLPVASTPKPANQPKPAAAPAKPAAEAAPPAAEKGGDEPKGS